MTIPATPEPTEPSAEKGLRDARHLRCGSCGEQALHFIILDGFDVPACLRHLNVWKSPDFTTPERRHLDALADTGDAYRQFHGWVLECLWCEHEAVGKSKAEALRGMQRHYDAVAPGSEIR